ncbi:hypothetical protein BDFB_010966, partial [Asbolus verrucosus]
SSHELFIAFSFLSNGHKIFKSTRKLEQLLCPNGIKAISMMWVILVHEYFMILYAPLSNFLDIQKWKNDDANMFIIGATVSVDTFFMTGGLVTVYTFLRSLDKGISLTNSCSLCYGSNIHQFIKLLWKWSSLEVCASNLVSVSRYTTLCSLSDYSCTTNEVAFVRFECSWGFVSGWSIPFIVGYVNNLGSLPFDANFNPLYYIQTYTKFGPYVIGMILGYIIYEIKKSDMVCGLWVISLAGLVACVYAGHNLMISTEKDKWGNSLFLAFNRPAWAIALS